LEHEHKKISDKKIDWEEIPRAKFRRKEGGRE
jgi:hypothetical protein